MWSGSRAFASIIYEKRGRSIATYIVFVSRSSTRINNGLPNWWMLNPQGGGGNGGGIVSSIAPVHITYNAHRGKGRGHGSVGNSRQRLLPFPRLESWNRDGGTVVREVLKYLVAERWTRSVGSLLTRGRNPSRSLAKIAVIKDSGWAEAALSCLSFVAFLWLHLTPARVVVWHLVSSRFAASSPAGLLKRTSPTD